MGKDLLRFIKGLSVRYSFYLAAFILLSNLGGETRNGVKILITALDGQSVFLQLSQIGVFPALVGTLHFSVLMLMASFVVCHTWHRDNLVFQSDMLRTSLILSNLIIIMAGIENISYDSVYSVSFYSLSFVILVFFVQAVVFLWGKSF
ncbi:hypothetical protein [uncultured Selenomonas sp.]|jgi:hypothetical protein|uniref:hypothetical protein n=1 Tax=uncultured Selenomonas sp. TaxID=159275 RepID=UPI0028EA0341|nr:hypothetical protein [uncultured Selenomonas sp.]